MALNQIDLQGIKKSLEEVNLDVKIYWIPPASLWNSTTVITPVNAHPDHPVALPLYLVVFRLRIFQ